MNVVNFIGKKANQGVTFTETPEGLSVIRRPSCAAAIWNRRPLESFQSWIDALDPAQLPAARIVLRPEAVRIALTETCHAVGTPRGVERNRLVDDIAALSAIFADLMQVKWLQLRLEVVTTNACRKFHVDAVTTRLVCTYRGTGTQYGQAEQGAEPSQIHTVPTGAPMLLRGTLRPEYPRTGLLHRSPPIAGTGETRLLLVLDPIFDPVTATDQLRLH